MKQTTNSTLFSIIFLLFFTAGINAQMTDSTAHHKMKDKECCKMKDNSKCKDDCKKNCDKDSCKVKTTEAKIFNKYCPVRGEEVDPETPTVDYKGKKIGFCCPGCDKKFKIDPEKYMGNLSEDGQEFIGEK